MMVSHTTLFLHTFRFDISIEIPCPYFVESEFCKSVAHDFLHCLRNQSFTPKGYTNPISDLGFCSGDADIAVVTYHQSDTTHCMTYTFRHYGVYVWGKQYVADNLSAIFYAGMSGPSCYRPDIGAARIPEQILCIILCPTSEDESFCFQYCIHTPDAKIPIFQTASMIQDGTIAFLYLYTGTFLP